VEATLTFDGVPLESTSQTMNSSDADTDELLEFEFTADDIRGLYGMIGRRVSNVY